MFRLRIRRPRGPARPPARAALALATCLAVAVPALAACASSLGANVAGDSTRVSVPVPPPGKATVALLRFYLSPGLIPDLRITNGYRQPDTAAFVGGIAPVGRDNTRFVGLVAIVNFANPSAAPAPRGSAAIEGDQPFFVDYLGDLTKVGRKASAIQAILSGIPGPEAWTVDWFNQPTLVSSLAGPYVDDGRSLLDATFRRLLNRSNAGFLEAIAGPKPAAARQAQQAQQQAAAQARRTAAASPSAVTAPGSAAPTPASSAAPQAAASPSPQPGPSPSPQPSPLPTTLSTVAVPLTVPGPQQPGTSVMASSACPSGTALVGGGYQLHTYGYLNPNNSLRDIGEFPSASDGSPVGSGSARNYTTLGGAGGQAMPQNPPDPLAPMTSNFALCATGWNASVQVVNETNFGPFQAATTQQVTASCPTGTHLIGGGAQALIRPAINEPSIHLAGDYPSDAGGHTPQSGSSPNSWTAVVAAGGTNVQNTLTTAFALCARGGPATQVIVSTVPGPDVANIPFSATATCPTGTVLLGGGVRADLNGGTPQQGVHLIGSFPGPTQVPDATVAAGQSWTGISHSGGQATPGTETSAFAVCTT